jgi:hypothetical protein
MRFVCVHVEMLVPMQSFSLRRILEILFESGDLYA